ncbi:trigger factor [Clostridium tyrobutyricum]|jgi:trigger factor|uniref:Trigger factor n=1 Tax=Clostridium tyrobutyricum DIVETGP TaxID=1408889 RepID=W6N814_CLOTY|nr:trigger factor [Clostridium tyrobutyricum]AND85813.1 trigger factor [Clostridium tyrobutyricum]ANP70329.1 trigger factor [Clostridium tyrobutyricum]MBR9647980.1 trigger factor [Clostridium tyrobutyricum]MBV4416411.1 trigger factor [Clostridium tyrobutyricum]MBV4422518.1 trigger factor [Clostridium tyrobutyricum]
MNVKVEKIENNVVKMEITVESEKFNEAVKKAFAKNAKKFNIPGFRKGKAPMNIIKKYYGEGVFYEDAINFCCDETYPTALKENDIKPVDYPKIDIVQIGENKDFIYSADVTVVPEVELGEYKGVEVKKNTYEVTDEEVEQELKSRQEKNARIETKEDGTVEKGNIAVIDFKGYVDDKAFQGGEGKDYELEIGSGTFIDNFEDQLIGLKVGDQKDVEVTFPEEYGSEELNGKKALFKVAIKAIKIKELPELDDEFAKEISEFDTLDEVKADIKKKKQEENELRAKREYEDAVIDAVSSNAKIDIPDIMVDKEIDAMLKDLEMRLKYQGLDLKSYYKYTNNTEEKVREYMRETAQKKVRTDLVISKIGEVENIKAEDEELLNRATEMAKQYGNNEPEKTAKLILDSQKGYLETDVINEKVVKMLVDNSKAVA